MTDDDRVLALLTGDASRTHGERLPDEIARALAMAAVGPSEIDLLAVATGPGAFTGLRIGIAAMQGLAMTLNKPAAGVSALDALYAQADRASADLVVPWMDAQRGDVFATIFETGSDRELEPPTAASPEALLAMWRAHMAGRRAIFIGDVAATRDAAAIFDHSNGARWETRTPGPIAPQIASIARRRGLGGPPHKLEPIYVRRPDAEIERDRQRRRADANGGGSR